MTKLIIMFYDIFKQNKETKIPKHLVTKDLLQLLKTLGTSVPLCQKN